MEVVKAAAALEVEAVCSRANRLEEEGEEEEGKSVNDSQATLARALLSSRGRGIP
jgi:hypothetical protein